MGYAVGPYEISSAWATLPEYGIWCVRAELVGGEAPAKGDRVSVVLGDLTLAGTARISDVYVSRAEVLIVGGADGWRRDVARRRYRADNGVPLRLVLDDLAADTGEAFAPLGELASARVGYGWTRPEGSAAAALDELGHRWWMGLDGLTRLGTRPSEAIAGARLGVTEFRRSRRRAVLTSPEDELSLFLPGVALEGEGLPAVSITSTRLVVEDQKARAEVQIA